MDVGEGGGDTGKDSVAEPLFTFLEELCELRGVSKWLRKTLISFVQITYGKTITKYVFSLTAFELCYFYVKCILYIVAI